MSKTPIFDATVADHPSTLWMCAMVFPWPAHAPECPFDGYNWHVCTCPEVIASIKQLYGDTWQLDIPKAAG